MLDKRKVEVMTRLAFYEQTEGKEDFKVSEYYRRDYSSLHTICSILWVTIGYLCLVGILVLIWLDELIKDIGFRRFYYVRTLGAEGRMKNDKEIHDYVLPCDVPFTYDDRARRHEYKAKDLSLTI